MRDDSFTTLAQTSDGTLWAGTIRKGLWHVTGHAAGEEKKRFTTAGRPLQRSDPGSLSDQDGTLWIGKFGGGLSALRDGKFVN